MGYNPFNSSLTIKELISRLDLLNDWLKENNNSANLLLIGGAALLINTLYEDIDYRTTRDIDVQYDLNNNAEELSKKFRLKMAQLDIDSYSDLIPDFQEIVEKQHHILFLELSNLTVYTVSKLMLLCIKSLTDRTKDFEDVVESGLLNTLTDEELCYLVEIIEEYSEFLLNPNGINLHYRDVIDIIKEKRGDVHDC